MLVESLKILLASSYALAIKSQHFHWNVEGPDFPQYHKFFSDFYEEINDNAIDQIAEYIRSLDHYAPASFKRFSELSVIEDQTLVPRAELMFRELLADNDKICEVLKAAFNAAGQEGEVGIENFLAERIDAHSKWRWQLRSILKKDRA